MSEMEPVNRTRGYSSLDHSRTEDGLEEFEVYPIEWKLAQYKQKWLNHISRMEDIIYPKQIPDCPPAGREDLIGQLKRLLKAKGKVVPVLSFLSITP
jgi:hypothetical protein